MEPGADQGRGTRTKALNVIGISLDSSNRPEQSEPRGGMWELSQRELQEISCSW